jgi:mannobiose 2-epimerase
MKESITTLKTNMANELDNILAFWLRETVDTENGGFYGEISSSMKVDQLADKGLVLNARILWTFAKAYRTFGKEQHRDMADRAYRYLLEYFWDDQFGGFYWMVDYKGQPVERKKQVYGQVFVIYALSEYYLATHIQAALDKSKEIFFFLEEKTYDSTYKGYFEAFTENWGPTEDSSLSSKDLNERKSMNTHLHVLEAYTNLYRAWKSDQLRAKLIELLEVMIDHIVDSRTGHFHLFFDDTWQVKSDHISYGHDIEGSWLLYEAAEIIGDHQLLSRVKDVSILMAKAVYDKGVDQDGGLPNEAGPHGLIDDARDWWPQAEAIVGFLNAYQLTNETFYWEGACRSWEFTDQYIIDKEHGEWHWQVTAAGVPNPRYAKVDPWKCPYHNSRACFEVVERLDRMTHPN